VLNDWGVSAVQNRHRRFDGTIDPNWRNIHFFNYHGYSTNSNGLGDDLRNVLTTINAHVGSETPYDAGLTEFNSSTSGNFQDTNLTADDYQHFASVGGSLITLTQAGVKQLYLFKFAQTEVTGDNYPVGKNGTHYVNNDTTADSKNTYGGASQTAEVYRLFLKAAKSARPWLKLSGDNFNLTSGNQRYLIVTRDEANGLVHIFAASRDAANVEVNFDLSVFNIPEGNLYTVEEVSNRSNGGVVARGIFGAGGAFNYTFPGRAVTLITFSTRPHAIMTPGNSRLLEVNAAADAQLNDGALKSTPAGGGNALVARSDGLTADGRRVTLLKFPVPAIPDEDYQTVLLDVFAATTPSGTWAQAHVYGLEDDNWDENAVTWAALTSGLKQDVPAGNKIANNVIANQGSKTTILGQLVVTSSTPEEKMVNVTDFVRRQKDGLVSFLIVQDHRKDWTLDAVTNPSSSTPNNTPGDTQPCGISITSREGASGAILGSRLLIAATTAAPTTPMLTSQPVGTQVNEGGSVTLTVGLENDTGVTYKWYKDGQPIEPAITSPTLTLPGAVSDSGVYHVVVTNASGSVTSNEAIVVIKPATTPLSPFVQPGGIAIDAAGILYVSDYSQHIIRSVTPTNFASTLAGTVGVAGSQNAVGSTAQFRNPTGLTVRDGKLYVADSGNSLIRSISADATVLSVGGNAGLHEHADGLGAAARFNMPEGLASDSEGNVYVADTENHTIRKISVSGSITTFAGMPGFYGARNDLAPQAQFCMPTSVAVRGTGANLEIYVADTGNHAIRKISADGYVSTYAGAPTQPGSSDGDVLSARFREPRGLALDADGTLYLVDTGNSLVRAIAGGTVTTIAGLPGSDTVPGLAAYKDGKGEQAWFSNPESLALGADGKLYVADTGNGAIRVIDLDDNVTTLPASTRPQPPPIDEMYEHDDSGGGGGAPSFWMLGALAALALYRKSRR
jgi:sugar lactone lactonase YvrE